MTEIKEWWGVVIGIVALIAWALRVESNRKANSSTDTPRLARAFL